MPLTYTEMFKAVNEKPTHSEWVEIFVSDWNKEYWGFYAYISKDNYETDIDDINAVISKLNWRDGDTYIELIDHSANLEGFYHYIYKTGSMAHWDILDTDYWDILEEKEDFFFKCFTELNGGTRKEDLQSAEFSTFQNWDEVLETYYPDLYKPLDEANGLSCFDIPSFFNCQGFHEIEDCIVLECD